MEVKLQSRETDYYKMNLDTTLQQEETQEMIVPDSMPDVGRILLVSGTALLRSKEATDGRVSAGGIVNLQLLYLPEDGGRPRRLEAALPFTAAAEGADIRGGDRIIACVSLCGADARAVNPRKLVLRAEIQTRIQVYGKQQLCFSYPEEKPEQVELLLEERELELVTDVQEKTFVIADEFPLPAGKPALEEVLQASAVLQAGECKAVGTKLLFKGEVQIDLLYTAQEDGAVCRAEFSTGFSQVVEMAESGEMRSFDVTLMLTGLYLEAVDGEDGSRRLQAELHAVAQATAQEKKQIAYIADAYCPHWEMESGYSSLTLTCAALRQRRSETGKAVLQTPTVPARVLETQLRPGRCRREEGKLLLSISAAIIYLGEDGSLAGVAGRFELASEDPGTARCVGAQLGEATVSIGETGFELRIPYTLELEERQPVEIQAVKSMDIQEDRPKDMTQQPSVILIRAGQESMWSLAKRFSSSCSLICAANGIETLPEKGTVLLIPRLR